MARQVKAAVFGLSAVPWGRQAEVEATMPSDLKAKTAKREGSGIGSGATYWAWPDRESMARQIRKEQKNAFLGRTKHSAVIPLTDGEGFSRPPARRSGPLGLGVLPDLGVMR